MRLTPLTSNLWGFLFFVFHSNSQGGSPSPAGPQGPAHFRQTLTAQNGHRTPQFRAGSPKTAPPSGACRQFWVSCPCDQARGPRGSHSPGPGQERARVTLEGHRSPTAKDSDDTGPRDTQAKVLQDPERRSLCPPEAGVCHAGATDSEALRAASAKRVPRSVHRSGQRTLRRLHLPPLPLPVRQGTGRRSPPSPHVVGSSGHQLPP